MGRPAQTHTPATPETRDDAHGDAPQAITVTLGGDAANQSATTTAVNPETLDTLRAKYGAAHPLLRRVVFETWVLEDGIALGRKVATERILRVVPSFAYGAMHAWATATPEQRARILGFQPGLIPVLLDEAQALRALNRRYDARARAEATSRESRETRAQEALRTGRSDGERVLRAAQRWATPEYLSRAPLPSAIDSIQNTDALAITLDTLASWLDGWRASWSADERAIYEGLQFTAEVVKALRASASRIRETQDVIAAAADVTPATQRELDAQDGRVLHVVGLIYGAFHAAARDDAALVEPELGELRGLLERSKGRGDKGEGKPDTKKEGQPA